MSSVNVARASKPDQMNHRVRVLLIAEACNPEWVSVPLEGFNLYDALRQVADVTLVTQIRNREALVGRVARSDKIAFIDSERLAAPFHRLGSLLTLRKGLGWTTKQAVNWVPYLYFEHLVFRRFRRSLERGKFDIIHRITPLTPTYPSPIASWTSVPFVLGPINGGLPWPKGTTRTRIAEMEWLSYVRDAYRVLPYARSTYQRAACVIAGSQYTLKSLPPDVRQRAVYIPENGVDPDKFHADARVSPSAVTPFRILFVGRLVPYKGADIVLEAFASSHHLRREAELVIIGDGPQRGQLESRASSLDIPRHVTFTGGLPQTEVARFLRSSSVFAFPSLREFGGAVVIEAMACGLPCVVVNHGGPAEHVTAITGWKIPVSEPGAIVSCLRGTLEQACLERSRLDEMSFAGVDRVKSYYTWASKARQIADLYADIIGKHERAMRDTVN
ncbi:MAG: glycosyltransferase family 4 protein [Phycisphaerales bacterium]|nr:MAG: glycosyltransferase family 4 protein [Phycisphaerales bacterium]